MIITMKPMKDIQKKKYKLKNIIKKEELKQQDIVSLLGEIE